MRPRWIVATLLMMLVARWVVAQRRGVSGHIMGASMASEEQEHTATPEGD